MISKQINESWCFSWKGCLYSLSPLGQEFIPNRCSTITHLLEQSGKEVKESAAPYDNVADIGLIDSME